MAVFFVGAGRLRVMKTCALLVTVALLACCDPSASEFRRSIPRPDPERMLRLDLGLAAAIRDGVAAIEQAPGDAQGWLDLGMTYEAHSQHDLAQQCYEAAVGLQPNDARAVYRLALAFGRSGRPFDAVHSLQRVLALAPGYVPASLRLGYAFLDCGQAAAAKEAFQSVGGEVAAVQGIAQAYLELGDPQAALDVLQDPSLLVGGHRPLTQRLLGLSLSRLGRTSEARDALAQGVAAKPVISDSWSRTVARFKVGATALVMRAHKMVDNGRYQLALELLEPLRGEGDHRVLRLTGVALARSGDFSGAAESLGAAAALEPDDPELALALAAALSQCLRNSEAVIVLEEFVKQQPGTPAIWSALSGLALGEPELVIGIRDRARARGQADAGVEAAAGSSEFTLGRLEDSAASFSRSIAKDPECREAWIGRARARGALGLDAEALLDQERADALGAAGPSVPTGQEENEDG